VTHARSFGRLVATWALFVVLLAPLRAALADDAPPAIRQFDVPTIEKLGREMYDQDQLAWKATDIALAHFTEEGLKAQKTHGWIVETTQAGGVVRFVHDTPDGPAFFYDVTFPGTGTPTAPIPDNTTPNTEERAQYDARTLAVANINPSCSNRRREIHYSEGCTLEELHDDEKTRDPQRRNGRSLVDANRVDGAA